MPQDTRSPTLPARARVICSRRADTGCCEIGTGLPHSSPSFPKSKPTENTVKSQKPHGFNYFHSPSCMWHTGHLVSLQACAGEGAPAQPAFLPTPRPPLRQGLRAGATWLFGAEREAGGRGGGEGLRAPRREGAPERLPLQSPGAAGQLATRAAEGDAITLVGNERPRISPATDVRGAESTFRAGLKRRHNGGNSKRYKQAPVGLRLDGFWWILPITYSAQTSSIHLRERKDNRLCYPPS